MKSITVYLDGMISKDGQFIFGHIGVRDIPENEPAHEPTRICFNSIGQFNHIMDVIKNNPNVPASGLSFTKKG